MNKHVPPKVGGSMNSLIESTENGVAEPLSVKEVLSRLSELDGTQVSVYGALTLDFEGNRLDHIPRSEAPLDDLGWTRYSLWVDFDPELFDRDDPKLQSINGRHVKVVGELRGPHPDNGGCGHMSLWPAEILVRSVTIRSAA